MQRIAGFLLALLLVLPGVRAEDKPKEEPKSPKMQFDDLASAFANKQREIVAQFQKAKGEEQQKLFEKYNSLGNDFADQFYKLAEANAKDPVGVEALFWIVANASNKSQKAVESLKPVIADMPLKDLGKKITQMRGMVPPNLAEVLFSRAEKDVKEPEAGDIFAALALSRTAPEVSQKAVSVLMDKFPEHKSVESVINMIGFTGGDKAPETLRSMMEKAKQPSIKLAAALSLGQILTSQSEKAKDVADSDKLASEAEKIYTLIIEDLGKDNPAKLKVAKRNLNALKNLRIGKAAPEISGADLDGKEFKLSDYRGKVVLLDFWGNW